MGRMPISDEKLAELRIGYLKDGLISKPMPGTVDFICGLQARIEDLENALAETPEVKAAGRDQIESLGYAHYLGPDSGFSPWPPRS